MSMKSSQFTLENHLQ